MHSELRIDDLTEAVMREVGKFGLAPAVNGQYQRAYRDFRAFAASRGFVSYSDRLIEGFLRHLEAKHRDGIFAGARWRFLRRASLLLKDYAVNGRLPWELHVFNRRPMPRSPQLLRLHTSFIDNLRDTGKSENTIQSCRNSVRLFLVFLEDKGCSSLCEATAPMVPEFFRHILATYQPTSIHIVASNIRCFLRFVEGGTALLRAVPSRCVRHTPIIPILSDEEIDALNDVLREEQIPIRDKAIMLLALRTGIRAVDIVGLKLSDIDWVNERITIVQSKTRKALVIPLSPEVGNALSSYILEHRPKTDIAQVFLTSMAPVRPLSGHSVCYAIVRRVFHQAGIRLGNERKGVHVLRHTLASRMLAHGVAVPTISSVLGHASKTSTDVYLQTDEIRMRECAISLAAIPMNCEALR